MTVSSDVDAVWDLDSEQLIIRLGVSEMGTEDANEALVSFNKLEAFAGDTNGIVAKSSLVDWLREKGKALFERTWALIKEKVCAIHQEGVNIDDDKDLTKYIVAAVTAALNVTNALAVLVISIAVKKGLDDMCPSGQ